MYNTSHFFLRRYLGHVRISCFYAFEKETNTWEVVTSKMCIDFNV